MMPLVSICIPAYNAEFFIKETLESALSQTYPNIEIIISDDCSTDKTEEIVRPYIGDKVQFIKQSKNLGMCKNWNAVIRASEGKYVLKLDADDLLHPDHVRQQIEAMETNPEISFAHCACRLIDIDGNFLGYERSIHGSFIGSLKDEWPRYVFGPRAMNIVTIRRSSFEQTGGYDERYKYSGDWAMHRALMKVGPVYYNDQILASYRMHEVGKNGVKQLQVKEHLMHLGDIELSWPSEVPNKQKILQTARRYHAINAIFAASIASGNERNEILKLIPEYHSGILAKAMTISLKFGSAFLFRLYRDIRNSLRQYIKSRIYKCNL